jgi:hypothetical protein
MDVSFIRGNVLLFSTQFFDASGGVVSPASVELTITTAPLGSASQTIQLPMSGSTTWTVEWDTTGIPPGMIFWAVQATSPHSADEGDFFLEANLANA